MAAHAIRTDLQRGGIFDLVTALAFQFRMCADQWISCLAGMIETPMRPSARVVACRTFWPLTQVSSMVILMAALAGHWQRERRRVLHRMTAFAFRALMSAGQREARCAAVIEFPSAPCRRIMALATRRIRAEAPLVTAILVTFFALDRGVLVVRGTMATLAWRDSMLAGERKSRSIVIERDVLSPVGVIVAPFAAVSELPFVCILILVTSDASDVQFVAIEISGMAHVTFRLCMGAAQLKLGLVVIEFRLFPFALIVTCLAFVAVALSVNILNAMTGHAALSEILIGLSCMTRRASDLLMRSLQGKFCFAMVERLHVAPVSR